MGAEVFTFDTIRWPANIFDYPVVYAAEATDGDCYKDTWRRISRGQFEWIVQHCSCLVSYIGDHDPDHKFYCNNHKCFEYRGQNLPEAEVVAERQARDQIDFEREI